MRGSLRTCGAYWLLALVWCATRADLEAWRYYECSDVPTRVNMTSRKGFKVVALSRRAESVLLCLPKVRRASSTSQWNTSHHVRHRTWSKGATANPASLLSMDRSRSCNEAHLDWDVLLH